LDKSGFGAKGKQEGLPITAKTRGAMQASTRAFLSSLSGSPTRQGSLHFRARPLSSPATFEGASAFLSEGVPRFFRKRFRVSFEGASAFFRKGFRVFSPPRNRRLQGIAAQGILQNITRSRANRSFFSKLNKKARANEPGSTRRPTARSPRPRRRGDLLAGTARPRPPGPWPRGRA